MYAHTSERTVRSRYPRTIRAAPRSVGSTNSTVRTGVANFFAAPMSSLIRGTPRVMFILETPAKWKVFRVIWVAGSAILWAAMAPTDSPGSTRARQYLVPHCSRKVCSWARLTVSSVSIKKSSSSLGGLESDLTSHRGCPCCSRAVASLAALSNKNPFTLPQKAVQSRPVWPSRAVTNRYPARATWSLMSFSTHNSVSSRSSHGTSPCLDSCSRGFFGRGCSPAAGAGSCALLRSKAQKWEKEWVKSRGSPLPSIIMGDRESSPYTN
mmetsp:Transcript_68255/g.156707  ORF Transcript_68255/g.156707 Transcript_68255/m.156707 type:complete len:267 (+) Transcript_68255:1186-1986(+)